MSDVRSDVYRGEGGWWFWDETGVDAEGPYDTEHEARIARVEYGLELANAWPFSLSGAARRTERERWRDMLALDDKGA